MKNTNLQELHFAGELLQDAINTIETRRGTFIHERQIKEKDLGKYEEITSWNTQLTRMNQHLEQLQARIMERIEFLAEEEER